MNITACPAFLKRPEKTLNKISPGRLKRIRFFSKTNRIVFLLTCLIVLLSGCPAGPGGITPPDPTAVGSDGSGEESQALPFFLEDFEAFVINVTLFGGIGYGGLEGAMSPGATLEGVIEVNSPGYAAYRGVSPTGIIIRPCSSGSATFTPLNESALDYHYIADKCFYPEDSEYTRSGFYDGGYKVSSRGDDDFETFIELDRYFAVPEAESISDRLIPPQDFRPLLSGTLHTTIVEDEAGSDTVTNVIDEMTIHGHGSVRNFSSVYKRNSEGHPVSYAVNYDVSQTVRDPVVVEGYVHQLGLLEDLMRGAGVVSPGRPDRRALANGTYELQVRTLETINYRDGSAVSGAYTINLVSHDISVKVHFFEGGIDFTYTNNGETQTKTVQN